MIEKQYNESHHEVHRLECRSETEISHYSQAQSERDHKTNYGYWGAGS